MSCEDRNKTDGETAGSKGVPLVELGHTTIIRQPIIDNLRVHLEPTIGMNCMVTLKFQSILNVEVNDFSF